MQRFLTAFVACLALTLSSCTGPGPRGTVPAAPLLASMEALAPYTRAGFEAAPELTAFQKENLGLELDEVFVLLQAATAGTPPN